MKVPFAALTLLSAAASADVVINEIHYDPTPKTDRSEFVELHNTGDAAVDLSNWFFSDGFEFRFPAGAKIESKAYLVIAANKETFDKKFASAPAFAGFVTGGLSNDGDRLVLRDAAGEEVDSVSYGLGFPWPTTPHYDNIALANPRLRKDVDASIQLLHGKLDNDLGGHWRSAPPTPGTANSVVAENAPPAVRQVAHFPEGPKAGEAVSVTARVTDRDGVASVGLQYQVVLPGQYIRLTDAAYATGWLDFPMADDGQQADATANDGIFSAKLPVDMHQHRTLVRYRMIVRDKLGAEIRVPYADDPQPNFAYFVYNGVPAWSGSLRPNVAPVVTYNEETMRSLPVYHMLAVEADVNACQYTSSARARRFYGTFVYDNMVYDHMGFETRGQASTYQVGKNKWDFEFPRGHRFAARDNYGRRYPLDWKEINGLPGTNPWWANDASTDGTLLNESLGFRVYQMTGVPSSHAHYFQLRIIDKPEEASATSQYEGDLWGLYTAVEDTDNRFLQTRDLPDGNIYHLAGSFQKRNQGPTQPSNTSDATAFSSTSQGYKKNPAQPVEWWKNNFALDNYYSWNVATLLTNNSDMRWAGGAQRNVIVYHHPTTNQWWTIPWDLDLTFENAPHLTTYGDIPQWEQFHYCLQHAEFSAAYQSRARELQDLLFNAEQVSMLIDEYARLIYPLPTPYDTIPVTQIKRVEATATVTTDRPHGFKTGDKITIGGTAQPAFKGAKSIAVTSNSEFTYDIINTAPDAATGAITAYKTPAIQAFTDINQAMWDHHPRKVKKGIWYVRIKGIPSADFEGYRAYMKTFMSPGGYGYENLRKKIKEELAPEKPTVTYTGPSGYPSDALRFQTTAFRGPSGVSMEFSALQWRIAEVTDSNSIDFDPTLPQKYEVDADWQSPEITTFTSTIQIPVEVSKPGRTYRLRAKMRNAQGHWSHWSEPLQFMPSAPDIAPYAQGLVITEFLADPAPPSAAEKAAGLVDGGDFEFIELKNIGTQALDLSQVRFTKGIDFDFATGAIKSLAPGAFVLLVSQQAAFEARYNKNLPVAGQYAGQLSSGGEKVKLSFGAGIAIREFDYSNAAGWPVEPGKSLVLAKVAANADLGAPASWHLSAQTGGSPGEDEGAVPPPGKGFNTWQQASFSQTDLHDDAIAGYLANPDGDEWPNWLEYVFGGNPKASDALAPKVAATADKVILTHGHRAGDAAITYLVEASTDLQTWVEVQSAEIFLAVPGQREVRLPRGQQKQFIRLRVTHDR